MGRLSSERHRPSNRVRTLLETTTLSAYDPAYAALKHAKLERLLEKQETDPAAELDYARALIGERDAASEDQEAGESECDPA